MLKIRLLVSLGHHGGLRKVASLRPPFSTPLRSLGEPDPDTPFLVPIEHAPPLFVRIWEDKISLKIPPPPLERTVEGLEFNIRRVHCVVETSLRRPLCSKSMPEHAESIEYGDDANACQVLCSSSLNAEDSQLMREGANIKRCTVEGKNRDSSVAFRRLTGGCCEACPCEPISEATPHD